MRYLCCGSFFSVSDVDLQFVCAGRAARPRIISGRGRIGLTFTQTLARMHATTALSTKNTKESKAWKNRPSQNVAEMPTGFFGPFVDNMKCWFFKPGLLAPHPVSLQ
jgi:hypothetical protein